MTVTSEEWETDLESVEQVTARDTIPAPAPSEPTTGAMVDAFFDNRPPIELLCSCCGQTVSALPVPPPHCVTCLADLTQTDHEPACPRAVTV